MKSEVYLIGAVRTPQVKMGGLLKDTAAPFLASYLVRHLLDQTNIPDDKVDEVVIGNVGSPAQYANIGRVVALEAGLPESIPAYTVHRNCASGMEALSQGMMKIAGGHAHIMAVGGVENMSQIPLMYGTEMTRLFSRLFRAKSPLEKIKAMGHFRLRHLTPEMALEQGLRDPFCGLNMGQTAEVLAREFNISREEQDVFANESHYKAIAAIESGRFKNEIIPLGIGENKAQILNQDVGPRKDSSVEGLAKMRPYFDRKSGTVTVGNSCPITDGGSALLLASKEAIQTYRLEPTARLIDCTFVGLAPQYMGMGPLLAIDRIFKKTGMKMEQMNLVEINEAFAAQVLSVLKGCREQKIADQLGMENALGEDIPKEKLNVNGGAIALGHPVGSTGSRLVVTLSHELARRQTRYGLAALCIGGGQGGALILENLKV